MRIILEEKDIIKAIEDHLVASGTRLDNKDISMSFTSGRKPNGGISVDILITESAFEPTVARMQVDSNKVNVTQEEYYDLAGIHKHTEGIKAPAETLSLFSEKEE